MPLNLHLKIYIQDIFTAFYQIPPSFEGSTVMFLISRCYRKALKARSGTIVSQIIEHARIWPEIHWLETFERQTDQEVLPAFYMNFLDFFTPSLYSMMLNFISRNLADLREVYSENQVQKPEMNNNGTKVIQKEIWFLMI